MGLVAGAAIGAQFTGDHLIGAPDGAHIGALRAMGAQAQATNGCLPVMIEPAVLTAAISPRYRFGTGQVSDFIGRFGVAGTTTVREKLPRAVTAKPCCA